MSYHSLQFIAVNVFQCHTFYRNLLSSRIEVIQPGGIEESWTQRLTVIECIPLSILTMTFSVSPFEQHIVEHQPSPQVRRGLMLMSKILQNIANYVKFSKEQHMLPFNDFLQTNFDACRKFVANQGKIGEKMIWSNQLR